MLMRARPSGHPAGRTSAPSASREAAPIREVYRLLRAHFGHLGWWPGESPFEICVGAILTQNTNWRNVEKAISRLREARALDPKPMATLELGVLAELIRPSGYYNIKAKRLRSFLSVLIGRFDGDVDSLLSGTTGEVRSRLLAIPGIGPETADSMLLYAGCHQVFVVDAYTRRVLSRHGWCRTDEDYGSLQWICAAGFRGGKEIPSLDAFRDAHAQFVMLGKEFCTASQPKCEVCPLNRLLPAP